MQRSLLTCRNRYGGINRKLIPVFFSGGVKTLGLYSSGDLFSADGGKQISLNILSQKCRLPAGTFNQVTNPPFQLFHAHRTIQKIIAAILQSADFFLHVVIISQHNHRHQFRTTTYKRSQPEGIPGNAFYLTEYGSAVDQHQIVFQVYIFRTGPFFGGQYLDLQSVAGRQQPLYFKAVQGRICC